MPNEAITEDLVRVHFKTDPLFDAVKFEEKITRHGTAKKCLSRASKKGSGKPGYPDFIVSFPAFPDEIIVIECKADPNFHRSEDINLPEDYAVDGALHYARFLAADFNVLAIGVSGQDSSEIKISSYYLPKGEVAGKSLDDDALLTVYFYIEFFKDDKFARQIEFEQITKTAIDLNVRLNGFSVPEHERCSIIGGLLLALRDDAFIEAYQRRAATKKGKPMPGRLAKAVVDSIENVLQDEGIETGRAEIMRSEFDRIRNHEFARNEVIRRHNSSEAEPNFVLRDLTDNLARVVFPLMKSGKHGYDVLGRFYTEFVRYSGTDRRTGLVLTPHHITEFFCDLVDLNEDDVVLDSCCGSGGFLISAMKFLTRLVGNNSEKREKIYSDQIIGVETRADMFAVACSNMIMSGDGKSNIYYGDSFIDDIRQEVSAHRPTVAFLNPPYHVPDEWQLKFIQNALSLLSKGGRCAAIVQISCAVSNNPDVIDIKEQLLKEHTLLAVLSMPVELFFQKAGVVTCIMLWEAKKKQPEDAETLLGYFRDDGHIKTKKQGRVDGGSWEEKKSIWLDIVRNKKNVEGLAIARIIDAQQEWVAEAYLETDYSLLSQREFEQTIKDFAVYHSLEYENARTA